MLHFTLFAGSEARLQPGDFTSLTIFGGTELTLPTLAQRVVAHKMRKTDPPTVWERITGSGRGLILTLFGGTELKQPTVMEEYAAMRSLITSAGIPQAELETLIQQVIAAGEESDRVVFTLFGACALEPNEREAELDAINSGLRSGQINENQRISLCDLVGAPPATVANGIGRLAVT